MKDRPMLECDLRSYCRCFTADERRSCKHLVDARECWWTPEAEAEKRRMRPIDDS
jgi:hypothetical protein